MVRWLRDLWGDEMGMTSVEYSLLLTLIVVALLVTWEGLGCHVGWTVWRVVGRLPFAR